MTVTELLIAVLLTGIAVSYGWGMRGAIIGGEKGAMLPGALLGFFLAKLSGIPVVEDNAFVFAAAGCLGMGYGGFEPYAQTMEMVLHHNSDIWNPGRGYTGLMLKGANWFGICAGVLGISFSAVTGSVYKWFEIVIVCALIPFVQALGIRIFNKPYDKDNNVFPKIYYSRNSREEWGGNFLTLMMLLAFTAIKADWFSFFFALVGIAGGAIGWAISIWLYDVTVHPTKNGKYILGYFQKNRMVDNWKIMEFALGFCGGVSLALYFFLRINTVRKLALPLVTEGLWNPLGDAQEPVAWAAFALAVLMIVQYFFKKLDGNRIMELVERAVYFALILCLVLLGSQQMSQLVVFLLIIWVVLEKNIFDRVDGKCVGAKFIKIFCAVVAVLALIGELLLDNGYSMMAMLSMYTFFYIFLEALYAVTHQIHNKGENSLWSRLKGYLLTYAWFCILSVVILVTAYKLF
ncbi:MAG: hypothetical protein IJB86_06630 [Clostridia bacterium]|nr:hypothetical protein [Clostridia bacterium]